MSTALLIRIEALEKRVAELEAWQEGFSQTIEEVLPPVVGHFVGKGPRGRFFVYDKDNNMVSRGFEKPDDAYKHASELDRGQAEADRLENA